MKADIHPPYHEVQVACSCGNKFTIHSTIQKDVLQLDTCYACHPQYTGKKREMKAGRVDRFNTKFNVNMTAQSKKPQGTEGGEGKAAH